MFNALIAGIFVAVYSAYLYLGIAQGYSILWLDWNSPYMHYELNREVSLEVFILPIALALLIGFNWYRSSMRGEA